MPEGEKKLRVPLVKAGQNLPPLIGIGLTDLPNIGRGASGPPGPPAPASLLLATTRIPKRKADEMTYFLQERNLPERIENIQSVTKERR